jgi:WD40-like Beta Propeller Repeat
MADADDLVVLGLGNKAVTWDGTYAGSIAFGGVCCRAGVSVAADAHCVAWIPWVVAGERPTREQATLAVKTVPAKATPVNLKLKLSAQDNVTLAISPAARTVAVFAAKRLEIFDSESGESKESLTDLVLPIGGSQPERMQLSADGRRLIVGYQHAVTVIDVLDKEILFRDEGRFPSISPDGQRAVYCRDGSMILLTLPTRIVKLDLGAHILGIGTWSPDSTMILAGLRPRLRATVTLCAVDWQRRQSAGIGQLPPEDYGEKNCWINRTLLSEQRANHSPAPK